jgi:hypothetical protein
MCDTAWRGQAANTISCKEEGIFIGRGLYIDFSKRDSKYLLGRGELNPKRVDSSESLDR